MAQLSHLPHASRQMRARALPPPNPDGHGAASLWPCAMRRIMLQVHHLAGPAPRARQRPGSGAPIQSRDWDRALVLGLLCEAGGRLCFLMGRGAGTARDVREGSSSQPREKATSHRAEKICPRHRGPWGSASSAPSKAPGLSLLAGNFLCMGTGDLIPPRGSKPGCRRGARGAWIEMRPTGHVQHCWAHTTLQ